MPRPAAVVVYGMGLALAGIGALKAAGRWFNYQVTQEPLPDGNGARAGRHQ